LRGGKQPNYDAVTVNSAAKSLAEAGIPARIMIDFSHVTAARTRKDRSKSDAKLQSRLPTAMSEFLAL